MAAGTAILRVLPDGAAWSAQLMGESGDPVVTVTGFSSEREAGAWLAQYIVLAIRSSRDSTSELLNMMAQGRAS